MLMNRIKLFKKKYFFSKNSKRYSLHRLQVSIETEKYLKALRQIELDIKEKNIEISHLLYVNSHLEELPKYVIKKMF